MIKGNQQRITHHKKFVPNGTHPSFCFAKTSFMLEPLGETAADKEELLMKRDKNTNYRAEVLDGAPLHYAPQNELGVIFLFAHILKKYRLRIDEIRSGYPDCIAYQKTGSGERKIRIEFELKSRNFKTQGHDPNGCDWIVCWEHNWPNVPKGINVIELRREFGLGVNVWIQPVSGKWSEYLSKIKYSNYWSVPRLAHNGDLLLYYHASPDKCIKDIFILVSNVEKIKAGWKKGMDYMGAIRRICSLKAPIFLEDLKQHKILKTAFFIRRRMQGRHKATEYWTYLYNMIVQRNPNAERSLRKYAPEKL
jgi:hypothetical protein